MTNASRAPERGSVSLEHIALLLAIVVALALALKYAARHMGDTLGQRLRCLIAEEECPRTSSEAPSVAPTKVSEPPIRCTRNAKETTSSLSTDVLFHHEVEGRRYSVLERSDGSLEILDTTSRGSGNSVTAGGGFKVGKERIGLGVKGSRVRVEERGAVYVLDTERDREAYREFMKALAVDSYVNNLSSGDLDAQHARQYARAVLMDRKYARISDGTEVEISGGARLVRGGVTISGASGTIVEEDVRTGETIVTFDLERDVAADARVILLGGPSGTAEGSFSTSLTLDSEGTPRKLAIVTETGAAQGGNVSFDAGEILDLPSFVAATAGIRSDEESGAVARVTTEIALEDEESQAAALAFADDPTPTTAAALAERFGRSGSALLEVFERNTASETYGAGVSLLGSLGFEGEDSVAMSALRDAWSWRPRAGLVHEVGCLR